MQKRMKKGREYLLNSLSSNEREFAEYVVTPLLSVEEVIPSAQTWGVPYDHIENKQCNTLAYGKNLIITKWRSAW